MAGTYRQKNRGSGRAGGDVVGIGPEGLASPRSITGSYGVSRMEVWRGGAHSLKYSIRATPFARVGRLPEPLTPSSRRVLDRARGPPELRYRGPGEIGVGCHRGLAAALGQPRVWRQHWGSRGLAAAEGLGAAEGWRQLRVWRQPRVGAA